MPSASAAAGNTLGKGNMGFLQSNGPNGRKGSAPTSVALSASRKEEFIPLNRKTRSDRRLGDFTRSLFSGSERGGRLEVGARLTDGWQRLVDPGWLRDWNPVDFDLGDGT